MRKLSIVRRACGRAVNRTHLGVASGTGERRSMSRPKHARRPARRPWVGLLTLLVAGLVFSPLTFAAAGDLDPTFDGDGKLTTDFGPRDEAHSVAVQGDGKIVVAGATYDPVAGTQDFALARYTPDGNLDPGFGSGGKVRTDFGSLEFGYALAIQADGKIIVAGARFSFTSGGSDFALARYNPDGSLDSSFGAGGKVVTDLQNLQRTDYASGLAIQADGKIVAIGSIFAGGPGRNWDFAIARYNSNGSLDTSFGGVGFVTTSFTSEFDVAQAGLIQPDGKIVVAGVANASSPSTQDFALARYNPDGSLDGSFGVGGKVETQDPAAAGAWGVAIQPDGKLIAAGGIVARYNPDGSLDPSFGANGKVALAGNSVARIVLLQPDRKLVIAGAFSAPASNDFLVARLNPNGSVDTTFGEAGQTRTDFQSNSDDIVYAAALQPDRRLVAAGYTGIGLDVDFALARYENPAPVTCRVPNVRRKKLRAARSAITKAHCRVSKVRRKASKRIKRGRVISQSPKAGTRLPNRGKVNLVVSRGPKR